MKRIVIVSNEDGVEGVYSDSEAPFEIVEIHLSYHEYTYDGQSEELLTYASANRRSFHKLSTLPLDARRRWRQYLREKR